MVILRIVASCRHVRPFPPTTTMPPPIILSDDEDSAGSDTSFGADNDTEKQLQPIDIDASKTDIMKVSVRLVNLF